MFVFKKKFLVSFQVSAIRNNFISKYPDDLPNINFKKMSMTRKYHNHTLQTNPCHQKEEPQNTNSHMSPGRELE